MERGITQSKKFIAAMTFSILWLISIWIAIHTQLDSAIILRMVNVAGVVQILYIGGQAALDTIVRRALAVGVAPTKERGTIKGS